ncbi:adenylate/guanylate cyclase domain-containing protein [Microbaculum marinisediminis]|uniref:Adenylate/guanylate cyclase domain-containing protein n=1 Tax=Microbaculum marinisediminis TaxID=2931392 RepID=A0AAW5QQB5_9HYPH|nr:adenylate/guanylate cyclase domain-containing protein [Microbaculum sp. A6E488]MCT8970266.1 adenylate/guanylate cyclase domain-containing protein [Microbaculum sp. A6E488]
MAEETQRRLAAIVAADVVGYSRLMGADEIGTLAALRACRSELVDPMIGRHGGRIVKTTGDGLLLEFPSVVAAVECAIAVQQGLAARNQGVADDRAIRLRVGVHVGDIIIEGDDIFGNGVNIAARIEPLSEPGGISLSDDAYRQVRDRLEVAWEDGGEHEAKNIARPIRIWRWRDHRGQPAALGPSSGPAPAPTPVLAPAPNGAEPLELPSKPSVAVLPFDNMSGDPEQEYFADGMTEDLITDLSKVSGLFVVARNSSFVFKGKSVDIREAAQRLGVRYVVEGSVRKAGAHVRINVQLIDALSGGHLWAERYDGSVDNVFELQDDVGAKVVSALSVRLRGDETERLHRVHTHNLDAYELYVRAKATPFPPIPERINAAREMFEQVMEMAPDYAGGYAGVSWMLGFSAIFGHVDMAETAARAEALARKAVECDDSFGWSYVALAQALLLQGRHDEAMIAIDKAHALQPNDADTHAYRAFFLALSGHPELGVDPIDQALRLNPQFVNGPYLNLRCVIKAIGQDYEGAVASFEQNIARHGPVGPPVLCWAATAYWALGRREEAARVAARLAERFPAFRLEHWNFFELIRSPDDRRRMHDLMRAAGLPE